MEEMKKRWIPGPVKWLLILVSLLLILFYFIFRIAFFDLLEGSVSSLEALLPFDRSFTIAMPRIPQSVKHPDETLLYDRLESNPRFLQLKKAFDVDPVEWIDSMLESVHEMESTVNQKIPLGLVSFNFWNDIFPGEVICAGKMPSKEKGEEEIPDFILLWRIKWKVKMAFPFMQEGSFPYGGGELLVHALERRQGFRVEGGNLNLSVARLKDVLIIASKPEWVEEVFARYEDGAVEDAPLLDSETPEEELILSWSTQSSSLLQDLVFKVEKTAGDQFLRIFHHALSLTSLEGALGDFYLVDEERLSLKGNISFNGYDAFSIFKEEEKEQDFLESISSLAQILPSEVFLFAYLKASPSRFFWNALYGLSPEEKQILEDGLKQVPRYSSIVDLLEGLDNCFKNEIAVCMSRQKFNLQREIGVLPYPAVALIFRLKGASVFREFTEGVFLKDRELLLDQREVINHGGYSVVRLNTEINLESSLGEPILDYSYVVLDDRVVFSSSFSFLKEMIDVRNRYKDSLQKDEYFEKVSGTFSERGSAALYTNFNALAGWLEEYLYFLAARDAEPSIDEIIRERERIERRISQNTRKPFRPSPENDRIIKEGLKKLRERKAVKIPSKLTELKKMLQPIWYLGGAAIQIDWAKEEPRVDFRANIFFGE